MLSAILAHGIFRLLPFFCETIAAQATLTRSSAGGDWNGKLVQLNGLLYCQQARNLLDAFSGVIREVIMLHEQQFQAVIDGDEDSGRFDDLIHMANERKREAKYAYISHLETHDCSKILPGDLKPSE